MAAQALRRCFHTTGQLSLPGNFGPSAAVAQAIWWVCASDQRRKRCYAAGEDRNFLTTIWPDSGLYFFGRRTVLKLPAVVYRASEFVWA